MSETISDNMEVRDPYKLDPADVKEPPKGLGASIRYLGPGMIMSASIVGSGELIATTALGAEAGFALLWLVIFSTLVKVFVQIELARWSITTGQTGLSGFNKVPPRFGGVGWISYLWLLMSLAKIVQMGGVVGGAAVALSIIFPFGEPLSFLSTAIWSVIIVVASIAMLYSNRYGRIEAIATFCTVAFTLFTVAIALGLPFTPFAYNWSDVLSGMSLSIPIGLVGAAIAMFGLTGVGADEITFYTYWCVEKGYARWTGPNDGTRQWVDRANGWIKVMQRDAVLSWVVYTVGTMSFYIMGAAVLHPQGLVLAGNEMITTLARMYTDSIGPWAEIFFLVCAVMVLVSTLWAAAPSHARLWANFLSNVGVFDWRENSRTRLKWIRFFTVMLPVVWGTLYLLVSSPVLMVQIGGIATGVFLIGVVIGTWYLHRTETVPEVMGSRTFMALFTISSCAILLLGVYTVLQVFGVTIG